LIRFILNEIIIETALPPGMVLLDFIRYHQHLMGTKIGCREGDCGACTVLVGELKDNHLQYQSMTCCLMPLANASGKHIVTIEGINLPQQLNPVQQALTESGGTQCGFCTPGFIMSMAGLCLSGKPATPQNAIAAIDGNICRCTGYKSIERAVLKVAALLKDRKKEDPAQFAAENSLLPEYFSTIKKRLFELHKSNGSPIPVQPDPVYFLGGGTDLYVQKHDELTHAHLRFLFDKPELSGVTKKGNKCIIGPSATVTDLKESAIINESFPAFQRYAKLVSSTPIRNMATIAGNFINASPIGDFTIFFLALDAKLILGSHPDSGKGSRAIPLRKLYKGYKQLDKLPEEFITQIEIELPGKNDFFHFEKVSKRTHLDIASVNSAIQISMNGNTIEKSGISAGGVGPTPLYLEKASGFLAGKQLSEELVNDVIEIANTEISPISDARGTADYKRLLLGQLIKAHFITLFPGLEVSKLVLSV
jgi:xanthine dehydrogenase small subunit